jgi:hypothetical protein
MKRSEFAERQYETSFHLELDVRGGGPFVPTQTLEKFIGIDAATNPSERHRIWKLLRVAVPCRTTLSAGLWPMLPAKWHRHLSVKTVSLFFQYKVPMFNDGAKSRYRKKYGAPYYEVSIAKEQQETLHDLQKRVSQRAVVRYASPAFWTRADFDRNALSARVLSESAYVSPGRVGAHSKWIYVGPGAKMTVNPDPEELEYETWSSVQAAMAEYSQTETLAEHVRSLATSLAAQGRDVPSSERDNTLVDEVGRELGMPPEDVEYLKDCQVVAEAAERVDVSWIVMVGISHVCTAVLNDLRKSVEEK